MAKKKAIKKVLCSVFIFVLVMSVIPVSVCATHDQAQIQTFTHTSGTVTGSTGPASEATSTTSLSYESIQSDGYGHYIKFLLYGPEEVVKDEIQTYVVRMESVDSDGNPIQQIIMKGNVYTCYKDDTVETYPVSIKERWNERWYDIDPEQDWDEDSIMKAVCGDLMSLAIAIPGLGTLLALFTENPPKPAWAVFYDGNAYDTIQIPFTPPTKWGSRYVPLVGEQPHPNAVELWIPYKFTSEGSHQIYFFMWAQGMAPSSPVSTSDFYITVEATTVTPQPVPSTNFTNTIGTELGYDDGEVDSYASMSPNGHAVFFKNNRKLNILGIKICGGRYDDVSRNFDIEIWDSNFKTLYSAPYAYTNYFPVSYTPLNNTDLKWVTINIQDTEVNGDFYIVLFTHSGPWTWDKREEFAPIGGIAIGVDLDTESGNSFVVTKDPNRIEEWPPNFLAQEDTDWMIRGLWTSC